MGEAPNGGCDVCAGFGLNLSVIFDIFTKKFEVEQLAASVAALALSREEGARSWRVRYEQVPPCVHGGPDHQNEREIALLSWILFRVWFSRWSILDRRLDARRKFMFRTRQQIGQ
jgi:hypothetical protein